jgi:hypothetical protein
MRALLRMRLASPMRLAAVLAAFALPLGLVWVSRSLAPVENAGGILGMILAAGLIGQDVSRGLLQATLVRPVTRAELVLSRWAAAGLAAGWLAVVLVTAAVVLLQMRSVAPPPGVLWTTAAEAFAAALATAAAVTLWSSVSTGINDVALFFLARIVVGLTGGTGEQLGWPWLTRAMRELDATLAPTLDLGFLRHGGPAPWAELVAFPGSIALLLALAIALVNRREYSYAAD